MTIQDWQTVVDAAEGAFSVELPAGWRHEVRLVRAGAARRRIVQAESPDGSLRLLGHDPEIPDFFEPSSGFFPSPPISVLAGYQTADVFVQQYLQQRFGPAPDFSVSGLQAEPELEQVVQQKLAQGGVNGRSSVVTARFGYTDRGRPITGLVLCVTMTFGIAWHADIAALFSTGDVGEHRDLLLHVAGSEKTSSQWQAGENQLFANQQELNRQNDQQWMNVMTQGHNQRMGNIAAAGAANTAIHNQRVAMGEASTAAYLNQLNQPFQGVPSGAGGDGPGLDQQHSIINGIREEETIRTASGEDVQVEAGADRYFVDEHNRTWVGAQGNVDANDFRAAGLDPDKFQEGQIR